MRNKNDLTIGSKAAILALRQDLQSSEFSGKGGEVVIRNRAWICHEAIILPRVTIGDGAVVAAGAVVSRDVESYTIVAGRSARVVGRRTKNLTYRCAFKPWLA